jgi:hypothetical protein
MTVDLARAIREPIPVEHLQSKFDIGWKEDGWRFALDAMHHRCRPRARVPKAR